MSQHNLVFKSFFLSSLFFFYLNFCICLKENPFNFSDTNFFSYFKRAKGGFQYSIKQGLTSTSLQGKQAEASKVLQLVNLILPMQSVCNAI